MSDETIPLLAPLTPVNGPELEPSMRVPASGYGPKSPRPTYDDVLGLFFEARCALCKVAIDDADVLSRVHELRRRGHGAKLIRSTVAKTFVARDLVLPGIKAFSRHLKRHFDPTVASPRPKRRRESSKVQDREGVDGTPSAASRKEHDELVRLYDITRRRLDELVATEGLDSAKHSKELVTLVGEARQILGRIQAARASDAFVRASIDSTIAEVFCDVSQKLVRELHTLRKEALAHAPYEELVLALESLKNAWPKMLTAATARALGDQTGFGSS